MVAGLYPGPLACTPLLAPRSAAVAFCEGALSTFTAFEPLRCASDEKQKVCLKAAQPVSHARGGRPVAAAVLPLVDCLLLLNRCVLAMPALPRAVTRLLLAAGHCGDSGVRSAAKPSDVAGPLPTAAAVLCDESPGGGPGSPGRGGGRRAVQDAVQWDRPGRAPTDAVAQVPPGHGHPGSHSAVDAGPGDLHRHHSLPQVRRCRLHCWLALP
jgi:Alpha/beta hydrolase domain containing 18